ncbi:MAG: GNAT family N-acetyltransferase [Desulfatiglans sp.]|nr:GNAT family N-acetyltransferase [Desulfatiglans sp.]
MYQKINEIIIRDWQMEDIPSLVKYADNIKIWQNLRDGFPHPYTESDAEKFITHIENSKPKTIFAIATENEIIGSIGIIIGEDVHRYTAEMGYWLAEPFWGKGIMTEAVKFISEWAFHEFSLHRIYATPYATNTASARVLEKAGFEKEGVIRSGAFKDGKIVDMFMYSLINISTNSDIHLNFS